MNSNERWLQENARPGEMTWRAPGTATTELHLRLTPLDRWRPYTDFPDLVQADPTGFSPGYSTFVSLLRQNWKNIV
jgi:hypothetical protein